MKQECEIVRDLLPLWRDGVCRPQSAAAVEEHLRRCAACAAYNDELGTEREETALKIEQSAKGESRAIKGIKRRIARRRWLAAGLTAFVLLTAPAAAFAAMKSTELHVPAEQVSVAVVDGNLVARAENAAYTGARMKRVELPRADGTVEVRLYFKLETTQWDLAVADVGRALSEFTLVFDYAPGEVDAVYYYTGEYEGLEMLDEEALEAATADAVSLLNR